MKIKKKLEYVTKEEFELYREIVCNPPVSCENCPFKFASCRGNLEYSWVSHKDIYSDKFLNQEMKIDAKVTNVLTKEEKKYLETVLKPLYENGITIEAFIKRISETDNRCDYLYCDINNNIDSTIYFKKDTMFKGMKLNVKYTFEDLELFKEEKPKKITLTEFCESGKTLVIHCDTKEKAKKLLTAFDKMGKTWKSGASYLVNDNWDDEKINTCYTNEYWYGNINFYKIVNCYEIYEFEDVDLES